MSVTAEIKEYIRMALPISLRKHIAVWLNNQRWLSRKDYLTQGILRDFQKNDPKEFHKFFWSKHILSYAKQYDSEQLFDINRMEPSRRIFFNDLISAIQKIGLDPAKDISSVLEVGCSLGYLLRFIETDILPDTKELVGIDIDEDAINKGVSYLRNAGSKVQLIHGDMEELDRLVGNRTFDVVFAGGVLSYLNTADAAKVISGMLKRTKKILALIGLACTTTDNSELQQSLLDDTRGNQWVHNFKSMVEAAGGHVVKCRWEGGRLFNYQTIYAVFAVPASNRAIMPVKK